MSELASTLTVLTVGDSVLSAIQAVSSLPNGVTGDSLSGQLSINRGDRVYVTNRGHDSIAVFAWDAAGALELLQHVPSGGASPRALMLLEAERQLVLANEEGANVVFFDVLADGTLSSAKCELSVPSPAFLLVAPG